MFIGHNPFAECFKLQHVNFLKLKNVMGDHHRTSMAEDKQYVKPPVSLVLLSC